MLFFKTLLHTKFKGHVLYGAHIASTQNGGGPMFIKFYKNCLLISKFISWEKYDTCIWEDYIISFIFPTKLGT